MDDMGHELLDDLLETVTSRVGMAGDAILAQAELQQHMDRMQDVLRRVLERWDYLGSPQEYDNDGVGELEKLHREACEVAGIEPW